MGPFQLTALLLLGLAPIARGPEAPRVPSPRSLAQADQRPREERARNVHYLLADDFSVEALRALGNPEITTPNLDRLVARGTTFTHAYCMGSWEAAVCLPSRSMILSGKALWRIDGTLEGERTWPQLMREAGYATYGAGKWHNPPEVYSRSFTHGGHVFFGAMSDHRQVPVHMFRKDGDYERPPTYVDTFSTQLFAEDAIAFLESYDEPAPFFAYVAFTAPHDPFQAPAPFDDDYDPEELALPPAYLPYHPFDNGDIFVRDERLGPIPRTHEHIRRHRAGYYAMVTNLDHWIGEILDALESSGKAEDTLIVFSGDHGLQLGRHGLLGKQNLYEYAVRTPAVFVGPGVREDRRVDTPIYLFDLFPTVLDYLDLPIPEDLDGVSVLPLLEGERRTVRPTTYAAYLDVQRSVRNKRYKLIRYSVRGRKRDQLFDLAADPHETKDLVENEELAGVREQLEAELRRWQIRVEDPHAF